MSRTSGAITLADELGGLGLQGSVTEPEDLARLVDETLKRFGRIDGVVNNTGDPRRGDLLELTDENWHADLDLILLNVFRMSRLVTPTMTAQRRESIVNISAADAHEPEQRFPIGSTYRAALGAWTKLYADRYAALGIRMTAPGSPEFHETARAVRTVAFDRILALPPSTPVVLTNVVARGGTSSGFLEENWRAVLQLLARRGCKLFAVTLTCSPQANAERIVRLDRQARSKIGSPEILRELVATRVLFDDGVTERLHLDNTALGPDACADMIATWVVDRTSVRKCLS